MKKYPVKLDGYSRTIAKILEEPVEKNGVCLYGSSFFRNWSTAKEDMRKASGGKYNIVNHGFGGATVDELLYYYHKLVTPYSPKVVIFRIGHNDIYSGFTAKEAWDIAWRILEFSRFENPEVKIVLLCQFEHKSAKDEYKAAVAEFNAYQKEYAGQTDHVYYLDINDFFYEKKEDIGTFKGFRDIFESDGLHLKQEVYPEFAGYLTAHLNDFFDISENEERR